jgi:hypothetical protein
MDEKVKNENIHNIRCFSGYGTACRRCRIIRKTRGRQNGKQALSRGCF